MSDLGLAAFVVMGIAWALAFIRLCHYKRKYVNTARLLADERKANERGKAFMRKYRNEIHELHRQRRELGGQ